MFRSTVKDTEEVNVGSSAEAKEMCGVDVGENVQITFFIMVVWFEPVSFTYDVTRSRQRVLSY